jgi:purine-binding chemotaxis protein CheW
VIDVQPSTFEPPPETLRGPLRQVILGVHKLAGNLLHVLDAEKACQVLHKQEASAS